MLETQTIWTEVRQTQRVKKSCVSFTVQNIKCTMEALEPWGTRRAVRKVEFQEMQMNVTTFLIVGVMRPSKGEGPQGFQHEGGGYLR